MIAFRLRQVGMFVVVLGLCASEIPMSGAGGHQQHTRPIKTLSRLDTAGGHVDDMSDVTGLHSTVKTASVVAQGSTGDSAPALAEKFEWSTGILMLWGFLMARLLIAQMRRAGAVHAAVHNSTEQLKLSRPVVSNCSAETASLYREVIAGYNRLKAGMASTEEVDELRERARSLLGRRGEQVRYGLQGLKLLLDWLDNARTSGRITITVQQLREKKMGSWDIECGIDAGGRTIKAKKSVNGNTDVNGCGLDVPWDANGVIKVWIHLTDSGYETCWGRFGPITMSSAEVLQETSGTSRALYTDQFDKDFKLVFKIQRNFSPLPCFANDMGAMTDAVALEA